MRRGYGAAGAGERLTPTHVAIPERPDAHAADAAADDHEEEQADDVGARAIIEVLLLLRVVLRLAAHGAHLRPLKMLNRKCEAGGLIADVFELRSLKFHLQ